MTVVRLLPAVTCRARYLRGPASLLPVLLAVAVTHAFAADVTVAGQSGAPVQFRLTNTDAANTLNLFGGRGQNAMGIVETVSGAPVVLAYSTVRGGEGYDGAPNAARSTRGGNASSIAAAYGAGAANVVARAEAFAGNGGPDSRSFQLDGGAATAQAHGQSDSGNVTVSARAIGGNTTSVVLNNAVSGSTRGQLSLSQHAEASLDTRAPYLEFPREGHALSILDLTDSNASALVADISALGATSYGNGEAGTARSQLALASTRAGAGVSGSVTATGGDGRSGYRAGAALASGVLSGTTDVNGSVSATGGSGGPGGWFDVNLPATALASLDVTAGAMASGTVRALGGMVGHHSGSYFNDAIATLTLVGAGARGDALAVGGGAVNSDVRVLTTGVQAVDVTSTALLGEVDRNGGSGSATANVDVSTAAGSGRATVRATAIANGNNAGGPANANVRVASAGDIAAVAHARGGYQIMCCGQNSGTANTSVVAITSGNHGVIATATSVANIGSSRGDPAFSGNGVATAYGQSGSGVVTAVADVRGGWAYGVTVADARAVTTASGGVSHASALATGVDVTASATANAAGAHGEALGFGSTASGQMARSASAASSSLYSQAAWALPTDPASYVVANATAARGMGIGAGMHAVSNWYTSSAEPWQAPLVPLAVAGTWFQFATAAGEQVQIAFASGAGTGFDLLEFTVLNHGQELFSRSFLNSMEADLFFNGTLLDLGLLGAGMHDLVIRSAYTFTTPGSYAFNYLVGASVSAVPEASTWLMLMLGLVLLSFKSIFIPRKFNP